MRDRVRERSGERAEKKEIERGEPERVTLVVAEVGGQVNDDGALDIERRRWVFPTSFPFFWVGFKSQTRYQS